MVKLAWADAFMGVSDSPPPWRAWTGPWSSAGGSQRKPPEGTQVRVTHTHTHLLSLSDRRELCLPLHRTSCYGSDCWISRDSLLWRSTTTNDYDSEKEKQRIHKDVLLKTKFIKCQIIENYELKAFSVPHINIQFHGSWCHIPYSIMINITPPTFTLQINIYSVFRKSL